jgi:acyl-CoA dehydrogenase
VAQAEIAYQNAASYAHLREQGRSAARNPASKATADKIIEHPDVRRMLLTSRAYTDAGRALILWTGRQLDQLKAHTPRSDAYERIDEVIALMTPVIKASCSDFGFESVNRCMDVFGGSGYVIDTGMEQLVRDCRIAQIHEGSNGINAFDLIRRALPASGGRAFKTILSHMRLASSALEKARFEDCAKSLETALNDLETATAWVTQRSDDRAEMASAAFDYTRLFALCLHGWMWAEQLILLQRTRKSTAYTSIKKSTGQFFFDRLLPLTKGYAAATMSGKNNVINMPAHVFLGAS